MPLLNLGAAMAIAWNYFTIIYLTGLGGLFSERSGIVNIGLEGMMIVGTVTGAWGTTHWGPVAGLAIGAAAGLGFSLVHAVATITFRVDHIVSGVVINLVAVGVGLSGTLAGFAGAFLAIEVNQLFHEGQTQGLGFIALAALILGNWTPWKLMVGAMLFGFAQAVPLRLQDAFLISALPPEFIR